MVSKRFGHVFWVQWLATRHLIAKDDGGSTSSRGAGVPGHVPGVMAGAALVEHGPQEHGPQ